MLGPGRRARMLLVVHGIGTLLCSLMPVPVVRLLGSVVLCVIDKF